MMVADVGGFFSFARFSVPHQFVPDLSSFLLEHSRLAFCQSIAIHASGQERYLSLLSHNWRREKKVGSMRNGISRSLFLSTICHLFLFLRDNPTRRLVLFEALLSFSPVHRVIQSIFESVVRVRLIRCYTMLMSFDVKCSSRSVSLALIYDDMFSFLLLLLLLFLVVVECSFLFFFFVFLLVVVSRFFFAIVVSLMMMLLSNERVAQHDVLSLSLSPRLALLCISSII